MNWRDGRHVGGLGAGAKRMGPSHVEDTQGLPTRRDYDKQYDTHGRPAELLAVEHILARAMPAVLRERCLFTRSESRTRSPLRRGRAPGRSVPGLAGAGQNGRPEVVVSREFPQRRC